MTPPRRRRARWTWSISSRRRTPVRRVAASVPNRCRGEVSQASSLARPVRGRRIYAAGPRGRRRRLQNRATSGGCAQPRPRARPGPPHTGLADPFSWKALRGAVGSAFACPVRGLAAGEVLERLRRRGVTILARPPARGATTATCVPWLSPGTGGGKPDAGLRRGGQLHHDSDGRPRRSPNVAVAAGVLLSRPRQRGAQAVQGGLGDARRWRISSAAAG